MSWPELDKQLTKSYYFIVHSKCVFILANYFVLIGYSLSIIFIVVIIILFYFKLIGLRVAQAYFVYNNYCANCDLNVPRVGILEKYFCVHVSLREYNYSLIENYVLLTNRNQTHKSRQLRIFRFFGFANCCLKGLRKKVERL